jgi:luciferase family oxidoreductase group 1
LACAVEKLGYGRYWLAEHHQPTVAHASPELLLPVLASLTEVLRVGTAGVLLSYYSPLKVAKNFRLLQALFPGRIDLGVGAGGVDEVTARELLGGPAPAQLHTEGYAAKVGDLVTHLQEQRLPVSPRGVGVPELWVLGSGGPGSAALAARHGAAYSLALFFKGAGGDPSLVEAYRNNFQPGRLLWEPRWNIAVAGCCAETEREACRLLARHANPVLVPTVVGTPAQCTDRLLALQERYATNEIIFLDIGCTLGDRVRSYQLLAEALHLRPGPTSGDDHSGTAASTRVRALAPAP